MVNTRKFDFNKPLFTVLFTLCVVIGIYLNIFTKLAIYGEKLVLPMLFLMLYLLFLQMPVEKIAKIHVRTREAKLGKIVYFLVIPILAILFGYMFLNEYPDLRIGLFMLMLVPCTNWYLISIGRIKGNIDTGLSLLPWNIFIFLALLLSYLVLFSFFLVDIGPLELKRALLFTILPLGLAYITRIISISLQGEEFFCEKVSKRISNYRFFFLLLTVALLFLSKGHIVINDYLNILQIFTPLVSIMLLIFLGIELMGDIFNLSYEEKRFGIYTSFARNYPISLAIALLLFPDYPTVPLALVLGALLQLLVIYFLDFLQQKSLKALQAPE